MQSADFANMRRAMVDSQLRTSGVTEPWVIAAMGELERENFVPAAVRDVAYMDRAFVLDDGSVMNPPVAIALMLQAAEISPSDRVLLVGKEGGYTAAVLAQRTADLTVIPDGTQAIPGGHSVIFIDGAIEELPHDLVAAAEEGARIVTGVTERGVSSLALGIVRGGQVALRKFADSEIALLPAFTRKPEFVF